MSLCSRPAVTLSVVMPASLISTTVCGPLVPIFKLTTEALSHSGEGFSLAPAQSVALSVSAW